MNASKTFWFFFVLVLANAGVSRATHMYYYDYYVGGTRQLDLVNGQTITVYAGWGSPFDMAVDPIAGMLYTTGGPSIVKFNLADGSHEAIVTAFAVDIAVDPLHEDLYWSEGNIMRSNLDGSSIETIVDLSDSGMYTRSLSLDLVHGQIYWSDHYSIHRANLDGSDQQLLTTFDYTGHCNVAVDPLGGKVYWTIGKGLISYNGEVWRANLDGSDPQRLLNDLNFSDYPHQVVLDFSTGKMYVNNDGGVPILQANFDGTEPEPFPWTVYHSTGPIALDSMILPEPASIGSLLLGLALLLSAPLLRRRSFIRS